MEYHRIRRMSSFDHSFQWSIFFSEQRFRQLIERFQMIYPGIQPKYLCRAPGRVNLIGKIVIIRIEKI